MAEEKATYYYPARVNTKNGEVTYLKRERHNELYSARATKDEVHGFEDYDRVDRIVSLKNSEATEFGGSYEYFVERVDEVRSKYTDNLSEAAKKWFLDKSGQTDDPVEA